MIGTLHESPLHAALKLHYARPGARFEVLLEGYIIDLVQADGELVEIQTGAFKPLRAKLERLLDYHPMRIVHPVAIKKRRTPRKLLNIFEKLVSFPTLITHPNLSLDVVFVREEKRQQQRHLLEVVEVQRFTSAECVARFLPAALEQFTLKQLVAQMKAQKWTVECFLYCARALEIVELVGKQGNTHIYARRMPGNTARLAP
ncbi:MAG: hypothetical protein KF760_06385 [Candidatus Eremiobacteraeota bacterium]|nr:hypothetical protein [Candidatus Eremiobacteraeota bacterium]MCW5866115.1 hypothetical protein [Candidatus Eremiobacteraeota bacterium]